MGLLDKRGHLADRCWLMGLLGKREHLADAG